MPITMVKKRLANGEPCGKCIQAEEMLKRRGLWDRIDDVVWADENDPTSAGMQLAEKHGVKLAPFFIASDGDGAERVYESALRFVKKELDGARGSVSASSSAARAPHVSSGASREVSGGAGSTTGSEFDDLARQYADADPEAILRWGLESWGDRCVLAFSGAEDVVLIDMASKTGLPFSVLTLDTGRLHRETYEFIEKVRKHYGVEIDFVLPQADLVQDLVKKKGLFSFYDDGHSECCGIRKVEPLRRLLRSYEAWVTGQRRDQSPATRGDVAVIERDADHEGASGDLVKINPLTYWTAERVWKYIHENDVPFNPLHERGFKSIGCAPCTRAVLPGEHERAGRWWWEEATKRECGLHTGK